MTRNDALWEKVVQNLGIDLSRPVTYVTERQLKDALEGSRRDLRNLVSMTSEDQWARVLQKAEVFVLPKSRQEWMLVHGKGYEKLDDPRETELFPSRLPIHLTTLSYGRGENPFLNHAYHSGLLSHFTGVPNLFETLSGRSGTSAFDFDVDGIRNLSVVQGTQMDIDKGYESEDAVLLFEAKARPQRTFLIRQLYYPFRSHRNFQDTTGQKPKTVRPFVFVANPDEETYSLWQFEWPESKVGDYEAILPVGKPRKFRIIEQEIHEDELTNIPQDRSVPEIQANDLDKVTALPFLIPQGVDTAKKWVEYQGWSKWPRQGNYYGSAAAALGLIRSEDGKFVLTEDGRRFVTLSPQERDHLIAERLLTVPTINRVFLLAQQRGMEGVTNADVERIIEDTQGLSGTTPSRRASAVRAWFKWLAIATGTVVVEGQRIYSRAGWESRPK